MRGFPRWEKEQEDGMKIVVWKSPKALRGILRMLFHIGKPEKEA